MGWRERNRPPGTKNHKIYDFRFGVFGGRPTYVIWNGWKRKRGRYYRRFKWKRTAKEFDGQFSRLKRSLRRMPEQYDDCVIKYQKSWKLHRDTQFKPKEI